MTGVDAAIDLAARLLDERIGLKPDPSFRPRLARALRDVSDARGTDPEQLVSGMSIDGRVLDHVLDRVTVQETAFFRHPEHFDAIVNSILPTINGPVRAWSSACANGQEAYSLAILLREAGRAGSVLATDISSAALQRTRDGTYLGREVGGLSVERRRAHFDGAGDRWQVAQPVRDLVTVRRHNLLDPIPTEVANCQIVMCRNVLIYFTQRHAEVFLGRLADAMHRDAVLFIGGAETLWHMSARFEPVQIGQSFVYRPRRDSVAPRVHTPDTAASTPPVARRAPQPTTSAVQPSSAQLTRASQPTQAGQPPQASQPASLPATNVRRVDPSDRVDEPPTNHQAVGVAHLARDEVAEAIVAFRQWAYLGGDDPSAHFHLGLALDRAGEHRAANRAYRAALNAFDRGEAALIASLLHGYDPSEFRRMLVERSAADRDTADRDAANQQKPTFRSTERGKRTA